MKRRDFLLSTATGSVALLYLKNAAAAPCAPTQVLISGGNKALGAGEVLLEDNFAGIDLAMPDGGVKRYPDNGKWAFTFWPGIKWPDSYGDGTNWLAGNFECQTYTSALLVAVKKKAIPVNLRYDPFSIKSDGLHIKASVLSAEQQSSYAVGGFRRFGSGMLLSRTAFTYGNLRMVAKLPSARGSWPAFWLLTEAHQWPPEIDVFEAMAWGPHKQQIHLGALVPKGTTGHMVKWMDLGVDPSLDFHEYGLDWTAQTLTYLFDGKVLWQQATPDSMKQNMYVIINLAVGGKWAFNELSVLPIDGTTNERLSSGSDLIQSDYPAEMIIKSIKITAPSC